VNSGSWLGKASKKAHAQAKKAFLQEQAISLDPDIYAGTDEELASLPVWHRTATTRSALHVSPTGAAILPKSIVGHAVLPHVPEWKKILRQIGLAHGDASRNAKGLRCPVADFLYDIELWHHQSTNGRWNTKFSRWERFGVRSVEDWRYGKKVLTKDKKFYEPVAERTFHRMKKRLIDLGLIEAHSHLWQGRTHLWIKPTDELSRMLFEPGYWDQARGHFAPEMSTKKKRSSGRKPRGISARHKELDKELYALYREAIAFGGDALQLPKLSKDEAWAIWDRLTKPIPLGSGYSKAPFAAKGTSRRKRLHERLSLKSTGFGGCF
jgi:hypothetical protein